MTHKPIAAIEPAESARQITVPARRGLSLRAREALDCYVFMLPAIIGLLLFWLGPILFSF